MSSKSLPRVPLRSNLFEDVPLMSSLSPNLRLLPLVIAASVLARGGFVAAATASAPARPTVFSKDLGSRRIEVRDEVIPSSDVTESNRTGKWKDPARSGWSRVDPDQKALHRYSVQIIGAREECKELLTFDELQSLDPNKPAFVVFFDSAMEQGQIFLLMKIGISNCVLMLDSRRSAALSATPSFWLATDAVHPETGGEEIRWVAGELHGAAKDGSLTAELRTSAVGRSTTYALGWQDGVPAFREKRPAPPKP